MTGFKHVAPAMLPVILCALPAAAQWVTYTDETATRLVADPSVGVADGMERDYAVGDFDRDGRMDLVVARKVPYTFPGGRRGVLMMNEKGVLVDRTLELASAADVPGSQGMLDPTNTRDVKVVDVNNDCWPDLVTAADISDGQPKYIGHPRVYVNLGSTGGIWQGFRFEDARMPQLVTISGLTNQNPRFGEVAAGDVTGDGFADLYLCDHDTGELGPVEASANDFNNRLLINDGKGFFVDESLARMGPVWTSLWLNTKMGTSATIADFNGDGRNDIMRISTLVSPVNIAIAYNDPMGTGVFTTQPFSVVYTNSPYMLSAHDLNHDGRVDIVISDDGLDRVGINTGTTMVSGFPVATWSFTTLGAQSSGFQGESVIADLDNDGLDDFIITDMGEGNEYASGGTRFTQLYHNVDGVSFLNDNADIPQASRKMIHDVAALDVNGDCRPDLVFAQAFTDFPPASATGTTVIWINNAPTGACPLPPCAADLDHSGAVGGLDLAQMLAAWTGAAAYGPCPPYRFADLNEDCHINGLDLAALLAGWGSCP